MRVHTVDLILKPSKAMCSLFRQVDEQESDSDSPATAYPAIVAEESLAEGSTSRRQSLLVPREDSEESDESPSVDNESQIASYSFETSVQYVTRYQCRGIQPTSVLRADTYGKLNNVYLQCLMSWHLKIRKNCGRNFAS